MSSPVDAGPAICSEQGVSPDGSRLLRARDLCDGRARPPIQEFLARMIDVRRAAISIAAHAFQWARLATDGHGQIKIIDVDGPCGRPRASATGRSGRDATGR